ncbi:DUF4145 domain-containing protein [Sorangium sp. So ce1099]|uniref:DUF4145 domain-containing protein n=1 Tax=Sorangium sp. So ce1099 TaxID=3133331 RepID=UPI003F5DBCC3
MKSPYTAPAFQLSGFNCPFCQFFASQAWGIPRLFYDRYIYDGNHDISTCMCAHCGKFSVWVCGNMVYPPHMSGPEPSPDLPPDLMRDYEEARTIVRASPRGAAALLRLVVQKLCAVLGEPGKNINDDIASLVKNRGLPQQVQQALDVLRVVGNNAVHPGQLDLRDDVDTVQKLFGLVNLVVEIMITQPKHVTEMYSSVIPDSLRVAIDRRDSGKKT